MSLKRRNFAAFCLLLLAAVCWVYGQRILLDTYGSGNMAGTVPSEFTEETETADQTPTMAPGTAEGWENTDATEVSYPAETDGSQTQTAGEERDGKWAGFLLCFAAAASSGAAIFALRQRAPLLGPDGLAALGAVCAWIYFAYVRGNSLTPFFICYAFSVVLLLSLRELWGWIRSKCALSWCLIHRIAARCPVPQLSLTAFAVWILAAAAGFGFQLFRPGVYIVPMACTVAAGVFGFCCLWRYGVDLNHFKKQLDNYRNGLPITVGTGAFAQTEAQLLEAQAQHEEAIHTAVTSERFKVELISNVSHDLRTPLTAILGYGELLQKEALSPEGEEQLLRLNQKAGYMRDLIESLFELTKVSSGAIESKKEKIDLIRLLEQTIGLFDDQLAAAGLSVKRHYDAETVPITTDGARMHQVFANLLGNAIKYALAGTRIHLEVRQKEESCLIRMVNTASYEMDFQPEEILQRFARGDKARSTGGSGLGLAIAQTYTESVGGRFRGCVDGDQFSAVVELPKTERNL